MPRILVLGAYGAGKSTFAKRLAGQLSIPPVYLDEEYYLPNWTKPPLSAWRRRTVQLCSQPNWVMDGNFIATLDQRLARATHVVYLRPSKWLCLFRVLCRLARYYNRVRPTVAPDCPEGFYLPFFASIINFDRDMHPILEAKLAEAGVPVTYCSSAREIEAYLAQGAIKSSPLRTALHLQS
ncbi:adenylate kinase [Maritalea mediterranea]|uniref:Adenylate kinase n=1 Tax=Maritalea mediterranea TaxID=2909667 RepID=A0ABS9E8B3_9HYPH|nr:adenylate kinase [Maritalea mediterranea]MCF4099125.1 adenylate kinase [Maritalea mediterranea]